MSEAETAVRIVRDPTYGFGHVDPMPTAGELGHFYESRYRDLLAGHDRAPELGRLVEGGPHADRERAWLEATLYADILDALAAALGDRRRLLDVGAGTGELVGAAQSAGWEALGVEPAPAIGEVGRARGLQIQATTFEGFHRAWRADGGRPFDAVTLLNVLEHVPAPVELLRGIGEVLAPRGCVVVRVPNDFTAIQEDARRTLGHEPWWVRVPDHVNYFDHASIRRVLDGLGYDVVLHLADFPMELFLLMGFDYVADPAVGLECHERRRALELALDPVTRRAMARSFVEAGMGRNALLVGQARA